VGTLAPTGRSNKARAEGLGQRNPNQYPSPERAEQSFSTPRVPLVVGNSMRVRQLRHRGTPISPFQCWRKIGR
jgi:hypothetical protein